MRKNVDKTIIRFSNNASPHDLRQFSDVFEIYAFCRWANFSFLCLFRNCSKLMSKCKTIFCDEILNGSWLSTSAEHISPAVSSHPRRDTSALPEAATIPIINRVDRPIPMALSLKTWRRCSAVSSSPRVSLCTPGTSAGVSLASFSIYAPQSRQFVTTRSAKGVRIREIGAIVAPSLLEGVEYVLFNRLREQSGSESCTEWIYDGLRYTKNGCESGEFYALRPKYIFMA